MPKEISMADASDHAAEHAGPSFQSYMMVFGALALHGGVVHRQRDHEA